MSLGERMDDETVGRITRTNLEQSQGWNSDELSRNFETAIDYYIGRLPAQTEEGSSDVISMDVADMVEAVLANMVPSISGDSVVAFEADSEADENQVDAESDLVNVMIHDRNNGFTLFLEAIKDALLLKVGIIKVFVERDEKTSTDSYSNLTDVELIQVLEPESDMETIELLEQSQGEGDTFNLTVRYTKRSETLRLKAVPPEQFSVYENWDEIRLKNTPFCAEHHYLRRSDLVKMGFDAAVIDDLPRTRQDETKQIARNMGQRMPINENQDKSQDIIHVAQCFETLDIDGDGIAELVEVWIPATGPTEPVLSQEPVDFVPYASGSPFLNPHRWLGYSLFDKLAAVQDVKTEAIRQWLDNAANSNVGRSEAVIGQVNMDDLANKRASGIVRVKSPGMIRDLPMQDIGPSMQGLLEYQDKVRSERGGAALDLQTASAQIAGDTAHGIERQYSSREQLAGLMTRTLSETLIKQTYLLTHATMRSQMTGMINFKRAGQWIEVRPASWPERTRVNVKIGTSPNERLRRSANIEKIITFQTQLMQQQMDGVMVDMGGIWTAMKDWARSVEVDNPEQYFIDPESPAAQQAMQQKQAAQQAAEQAAKQQQDQMMALQMQVHQSDKFVEQWSALLETQFKYFDAVLNSEVEEAKILKDVISGQLQGVQALGQQKVTELGAQSNGGAGV